MKNTSNITLSNNEKIELIMNLSTMIAAGISILSTVDSLLEDAKGNQKKLLQAMHDNINQGKHLYTAFSQFPRIFDTVTVNIIKAAEESGTLDVVLKDLKNTIRKEMEFSDRIKSALMYPVMIVFVFIGVLLMILIVVIPKIATVFLRMNVKLPLPTRVLIFASNIVLNHPILLILTVSFCITVLFYLFKKNKNLILQPLYHLPVISPLVIKIDLTRFTYSLYLLLSSGIPITSALQLLEDVVKNREVFQVIKRSGAMINQGKRLSDGLRTGKGTVPSIITKIVEAGEKSGSLDKSLHEVSEYLDYEVSSGLKTATAMLEPIMLVVVGILVGGMMMSIIAPIYSLIGSVGAR